MSLFYDEVYIRSLLYGNLSQEQAKQVAYKINNSFANSDVYPEKNQQREAVIDLSKDSYIRINSKTFLLSLCICNLTLEFFMKTLVDENIV